MDTPSMNLFRSAITENKSYSLYMLVADWFDKRYVPQSYKKAFLSVVCVLAY